MGFTAQDAVAGLDWSFRPHVNAGGVTPEPSRKMIDSFREALQSLDAERAKLADLAKGEDDESKAAFRAAVAEIEAETIAILADLTSGSPSADQMVALNDASPRTFAAYLNSIVEDVLNPEA